MKGVCPSPRLDTKRSSILIVVEQTIYVSELALCVSQLLPLQ